MPGDPHAHVADAAIARTAAHIGSAGDTEVTWRLASADDVPALVDLIRAAYRGAASHERWTSEEHLVGGTRTDEPSVLAAIEAQRSEMLLVDGPDGRPIASCRIADRGGGLVSFQTFAVDHARQGSGIGRRLVGWAQDAAADLFGARTMELEVLAQQQALRAWYERLGFAPTGEARPFPSHPVYAVPRRDDLHLIVLAKSLRTSGG